MISPKQNSQPWQWLYKDSSNGPCLELRTHEGHGPIATVFLRSSLDQYVWHVWDYFGVGGENIGGNGN
jgi:hypothetical protein